MEYILPVVWVVIGLIVLVFGGEMLVRSASAMALAARISPLVIGLTVVAFGTSSPELAVSVQSSFAGEAEIAVGNAVGSNICNVLLILGLSALAAPLAISGGLLRVDVPIMVVSCISLFVLGLDGGLGRLDGGLMFGCLLVYLVVSIRRSRQGIPPAVAHEFETLTELEAGALRKHLVLQVVLMLVSLVALAVGSHWLVQGSVDIARLLGVSELMIGLTIIAVGTSLPEVVTSVMASLRGARDIAVGNVVGSNLFNMWGVLGPCALIAPGGVRIPADALWFDIPVMIAVAAVCLPIFFTGREVSRREGGAFLAYYVIYITYLVLDASDSALARPFGIVILWVALPLTALVLLIGVIQSVRHAQQRR